MSLHADSSGSDGENKRDSTSSSSSNHAGDFDKIQKYLEAELGLASVQTKNKFVSDLFQSFLIPWEQVGLIGHVLDKLD